MSFNSIQQKNIVNWQIQSTKKVSVTDKEILKSDFSTSDWYRASTPSTVLGTLVENGVYKDPFFGNNLDNIDKEPFSHPWWFRSEFELSAEEAKQYATLDFDGINYRADI